MYKVEYMEKSPEGFRMQNPSGQYVIYYMCLTASIETRNPNAVLIGTKFGFLNCV